mmetsp:Transcript_65964/g.141164  ORF Transcript_65964/g.141164 Transcript_65964/m.141164 type:complete len:220 (+) Transcript_65964:174-833(+)
MSHAVERRESFGWFALNTLALRVAPLFFIHHRLTTQRPGVFLAPLRACVLIFYIRKRPFDSESLVFDVDCQDHGHHYAQGHSDETMGRECLLNGISFTNFCVKRPGNMSALPLQQRVRLTFSCGDLCFGRFTPHEYRNACDEDNHCDRQVHHRHALQHIPAFHVRNQCLGQSSYSYRIHRPQSHAQSHGSPNAANASGHFFLVDSQNNGLETRSLEPRH